MSYRFVRRLMMDQTWIHNNFYVKPLQFPTSDVSRTFYFTAQGPSGSQYGLLGELHVSSVNPSKVIQSVNTLLLEAISECSDDVLVFESLCKKLDDTFNAISIALQLWTRQVGTSFVSVISMGLHMLRYVTKDYQEIKLPNNTTPYESQKIKKYVRDEVCLEQTQFMFLATNGFSQPSFINRPDSIFELSKQLTDLFFYKIYKNPSDSKDACILLMDFCKFNHTYEFVRYGLDGFDRLDHEIEDILKVVPSYHDHFAAKLILSELLMNAFKQGNAHDMSLPIKIIVAFNDDEMVIEVFDMNVRSESMPAKSMTDHDYLLDEYGRGLFLANAFSNDVYIDNNSIASRIKRK